MPEAQQFQLSGAPSNVPSAESAYAGGLQAEQFAAQMSLEAGRGVERGAQTIFSIIAARQAQQQALANEMALSERQFALRKDLGAIEFQQTLALHSAQDAAAMAQVIRRGEDDLAVARQNYEGDVARYTAQADAKRKEAEAQGNAQSEVTKLFSGAPDLEMSQAQAMGLDEAGLDTRLQTFPVLEGESAKATRQSYAAPLLKSAKAKIVTPEMQLRAVEILRRAGISNPENTVKDLMGTMGAHSSAQEFSDSLASKFNEGLKGLEPKKQTESSGLFKPGLPLGGGRPISMASEQDLARINDYAQDQYDKNADVKSITSFIGDPSTQLLASGPSGADMRNKIQEGQQRLQEIRSALFEEGRKLSGFTEDTKPAPEKPVTNNGAPPETQADRIAADPRFNTKLSPEQEAGFAAWKAKYAPKDSGYDYDLRGAYAAGVTPDPKTGHWPDTFKKPNHPTFSDESKYAPLAPDKAGHWNGDTYVRPTAKTSAMRKAAEALLGPGSEEQKAIAMSRVLRAAGIDPTTLSDADEQEMRTWAAFLTPSK